MTAQVSDKVLYQGRGFQLSGVQGTGLFDPAQHGLKPHMMSTACWRGFICTYGVSDGGLFLEKLCIGLGSEEELKVKEGKGLPLFGKPPRYSGESHEHVVYEDLRGPVPFSGGLLVATGFLRELYVHMGFHPAWKYTEVHELLFEEGRLTEARDCSEAMARVRERMKNAPLAPGSRASKADVEQWIEKTFRLDYD
jgi:hypothetical protein